MSEIKYTYKHEDFNLNSANDYTLLLQVNNSDFTYAVVHDEKLMALAERCNFAELAKPALTTDELTANYREVVVGVDATGFTLVPATLFSPDKTTSFARFLDVNANEKVFAQELDADNYIVYKTSDDVVAAVEKFGLNQCAHASKGWINAIAVSEPVNTTFYVNIEQHRAEFLCFKNGKIRLYNSFDYSTADDLVYFAGMV